MYRIECMAIIDIFVAKPKNYIAKEMFDNESQATKPR